VRAAQLNRWAAEEERVNGLSKVFIFKITATVIFWCVPLIFLPAELLATLGFPEQPSYMFVRMLGWAYLALCVGYAFGLSASLQGQRALGPIWVGIVSNGGACAYLIYYGLSGEWAQWGGFVQFVLWSSIAATAAITTGLYLFGVRGSLPPNNSLQARRP
jgi:hypothetical protein